MLDTRVLKTPAKRPLVVPTKALALAIAGEWESQVRFFSNTSVQRVHASNTCFFCKLGVQKKRIDANTMPLMSLAATAIDQPQPRSSVIETMVHYVATDPVLCREETGPVAKKQKAVFDPIVSWLEQEIGVALTPTHSIFGLTLTDRERAALRNYLYSKFRFLTVFWMNWV